MVGRLNRPAPLPTVTPQRVSDGLVQRAIDNLTAAIRGILILLQPYAQREPWKDIDFSLGTWRRESTSGFCAPQYRKNPFNVVTLRGAVEQASAGTTIGVLPEGYRPPGDMVFSVRGNAGAGEVQILASGLIFYSSGGTTFLSLDGIQFDTEE